jgi:hypothetical protein
MAKKSMIQHMYSRASLSKKNGEDPPKKGVPGAISALKAPSPNLLAKTEYVPIAKALKGTEFSSDRNYNRNNANRRNMPKVEAGGKNREYYKKKKEAEDKTNVEMKNLRKSFENQYNASLKTDKPWTKQQLRDSIESTHTPDIKPRQIKREVRKIAGGTAVGDMLRDAKDKTKTIAKATGKKIKKMCNPVQKGKPGSGVNLCTVNRVGDIF